VSLKWSRKEDFYFKACSFLLDKKYEQSLTQFRCMMQAIKGLAMSEDL
jgi:hypothetical protein